MLARGGGSWLRPFSLPCPCGWFTGLDITPSQGCSGIQAETCVEFIFIFTTVSKPILKHSRCS